MYKRITARRARGIFDRLNAKDTDALVADISEEVRHVFPGDHPLGGERRSPAAMRLWFERLFRLYPELHFEVHRVTVKGPPWDMWIAIAWSDRGRAADGEPYENEGAHWIRIERGKATHIQAYLDTQVVKSSCRRMAAAGIDEAAADPITAAG